MLDLLFENCTLLDADSGESRACSVGIKDGSVACIEAACERKYEAAETVRCGGSYLFPGLIDFHTHLFAHGSGFGMEADRLAEAGITCAVDMGTAGWINYPAFHKCDVEGQKIHIKSFLNVSPIGQPGKGISEPLTDDMLSIEKMAEVISRWPDEIVGLKVRISKNIVKNLGLKPLEKAVEAGEALGLPVCVHTTDPPAPAREIVKYLRPGDIYSHMYHGEGETIISGGRVEPELFRARERGVLFEVGNGRKNFDFRVAEQAMKEGFMPDIITSDSTRATFHQEGGMWNLAFVMSKFLDLGMNLQDVIKSVTETPARIIGYHGYGAVREGAAADLALCRVSARKTRQYDSYGNERVGKWLVEPLMTVLGGKITAKPGAIDCTPKA